MDKIEQADIARIRDGADIVSIIEKFVPLKKTGGEFKGLCPFHAEKSPSFHVHPGKKFYKCFGCGASGDVIKFIRQYQNLRFYDAVRKVADLSGQRHTLR